MGRPASDTTCVGPHRPPAGRTEDTTGGIGSSPPIHVATASPAPLTATLGAPTLAAGSETATGALQAPPAAPDGASAMSRSLAPPLPLTPYGSVSGSCHAPPAGRSATSMPSAAIQASSAFPAASVATAGWAGKGKAISVSGELQTPPAGRD